MTLLSYYYSQTWVSSTRMNHYPSPSTGARKVIGLSFFCGGEGGNENYEPSVCSCCCRYFAPRDMTNNCHLKRAGVVATAQLERAGVMAAAQLSRIRSLLVIPPHFPDSSTCRYRLSPPSTGARKKIPAMVIPPIVPDSSTCRYRLSPPSTSARKMIMRRHI